MRSDALTDEVLKEVRRATTGTRITALGNILRKRDRWKSLRDVDIKAAVVPMVMRGQLKYTPDLKITIAKSRATAKSGQ